MGEETLALTKRFIESLQELKAKGRIKTDAEAAAAIGYPKANLSAVLKGRRNIPYKYAAAFAQEYQIPNFFGASGSTIRSTRQPEPLYKRPYNLPLISSERQGDYIKNHTEPGFIETFDRYPVSKGVELHGATWRWFEAGGQLAVEGFEETDSWLGRMIHPDDYLIRREGEKFILITSRRLAIVELERLSSEKLHFRDSNGKGLSTTRKSILELWLIHSSILKPNAVKKLRFGQ